MPAAPGRVQAAASSGSPDGEKATAVSVSGAHRRPAGAAARACTLVSGDQVAAPGPACVDLGRRRAGRAGGRCRAPRPGRPGRRPAGRPARRATRCVRCRGAGQRREHQVLAGPKAGDERLVRPGPASTRPPLLATPGGVTSRHAADPGRAHEELPEVVMPGRGAAEHGDGPACRPGVTRVVARLGGGGGVTRSGPGWPPRRSRGGHCQDGGRDSGQPRGLACSSRSPAACRAASASSTANDDCEAAVPGPGSVLMHLPDATVAVDHVGDVVVQRHRPGRNVCAVIP